MLFFKMDLHEIFPDGGSAFGQMGLWISTFEQGDDEDDSAATA